LPETAFPIAPWLARDLPADSAQSAPSSQDAGKVEFPLAPASSRIACCQFVTLYRLHIRLVPYRHMPRMRAATSTRTPWPAGRVAVCTAETGQVVAVKRWRMLLGTNRVRDA
jgi:hypothetical protein